MPNSSRHPGMPIPMGIPGEADVGAYYENKSRTVPQALAPEIRAYWSGPAYQLTFAALPAAFVPSLNIETPSLSDQAFGPLFLADGVTPVVGRAIWQSPLFDLRPDLKASSSYTPTGVKIARGSAYGSGARVMVHLTGHNTIVANQEIAVFEVERGHPNNPNAATFINQRQDITTQFFDNAPGVNGGVSLEVMPVGNPMRYWGFTLIFELHDGALPGPQFLATGEAH